MPRLPGLYLINGFGARGIVWSALAGELLAWCLITGAPPASPTTWSAPSIPAASCCALRPRSSDRQRYLPRLQLCSGPGRQPIPWLHRFSLKGLTVGTAAFA
jgi:hypothetical protein